VQSLSEEERRLRYDGMKVHADASPSPRISVIVPVRNGSREIVGLLAALDAQSLPRGEYEIVIGDDGSTDDLHRVLEDRSDVRLVSGPPLSSSAARNRAARSSRGSALAFVDADCRPEPSWLEQGLLALETADIVGGHINWLIPEDRSIWSLLEVDTFVDQKSTVLSGSAVTGNLFVRRELFERVQGFDEELHFHGDMEFVQRCTRSGGRLAYSKDAVVWHPTANSRRYYLHKLWVANSAYAAHTAQAGETPDGLRLREWLPIIQTVRSRLRWGRPLTLNRHRLAESGTRASVLEHLAALPMIYLVVPYLRCTAQVSGARAARRPNV